MSLKDRAVVTYYDEETQTFKTCAVLRDRVQGAIDRAVSHEIEPQEPDVPIGDEHARVLGGMIFLILAAGYPELRSRLQITTKEPMDWTPPKPPVE
ncbi:hypothetical protein [Burkholderia multivorans]|uniref:hypothetical protein n=1 Tax=Burkholderia multivorans TaxID=87883 RepID=UPI00075DD69D|nr:hypothetical protein [Burkholderia multivorans]KVT46733.1 hypothetical protein WK52_00260 [Burkholderia multivorans]